MKKVYIQNFFFPNYIYIFLLSLYDKILYLCFFFYFTRRNFVFLNSLSFLFWPTTSIISGSTHAHMPLNFEPLRLIHRFET